MKKYVLIFLALIQLSVYSQRTVILPEGEYKYWPSYTDFDINKLKDIKPQTWTVSNGVVEGWDWSLPSFVEPSKRSSIAFQRNQGWKNPYINLKLQFKANPTGLLWVKWRDIEPTKDNYNFKPLIERIQQAKNDGVEISLRILCHSQTKKNVLANGEAPLYLSDLGCSLLPKEKADYTNLNFNPADPIFHERYLKLINEIGKTEIPNLLKNMYVGYASHTFGDEGIGPYEEETGANDTVKHVRERLDAWEKAFVGQETKVYMGGSTEYGFKKGFGARRGFVEMYYYNAANPNLGSYVDSKGYFCTDENAPLIRYNCMNGEVNEEYGLHYVKASGNSYGISSKPFSYRYFMSMLRVLQMRCTYVHDGGALIPEMVPFIAQELGRTVEDAPDVWSFLNTFYLKENSYSKSDWQTPKRTSTELEKKSGIETKNFERWLYQRDAVGYETTPAVPIQHAIRMFSVQPDKYFDHIARAGKKIGFNIDDRWVAIGDSLSLKVSYFDNHKGELNLVYHNGKKETKIAQTLLGDGKLRTATFFVPKIKANSLPHNFDFALEAGSNTEKIVVSMVRVVQAKQRVQSKTIF